MKPLSTASEPLAVHGGADEPSPALRLATFMPYRLNVLATVISEGLAQLYAERFLLDIPGWRVLATIGEFGEITAKSIGQHAHMNKVKVSRAVADLEARGWIERQQNPDDMRESFLTLTVEGQRNYREIVPLAHSYEARLRANLNEQEQQIFDLVIDKILASVSARETHEN
ncbi:MarR family winged helix-turn-helix transcriptional regulator [Methylobacterium indicum]|uniref:MarR family winged helix-turn-helix transcriptional regulator n=1 Tax=Methylobacterium indicum TaxID=1775910 RepID=UPI000B7AF0E3|nr:MarR family transcriptional regulator [Methylobacterium indicum]